MLRSAGTAPPAPLATQRDATLVRAKLTRVSLIMFGLASALAPLLNAVMMIGTRIMYAMGRDGWLPHQAARVNAGGTPTIATLITTVVAIGLIATGTFQKLVAIASFFLAANYFICCLALVVLRRREPALARPFRAWGYPVSAGIVLAGAAAFLASALVADTANAATALGLAAVGFIIRSVTYSRRS